ncbi:MAG: aminoacetone oxidase family FAD-binding enzyme [Candidatus Vogelbacteria bacterium]|nr:aminoacetone oxidase family FAD-binding enzyme [Candidatus Vogelbacteria bacterium]
MTKSVKLNENELKFGQYDVIVVGGGPSGMMAAGRAGERGLRVLLLEKNKMLGEKLKITGGGRCNITNATFDTRAMLANYGDSEQFLYSPFAQFGVKDTFTFFESRGLPLVVQARERAFPASEKAEDVFLVMEKYMKDNKVAVKTGVSVKGLLLREEKVVGVEVGGEEIYANSVIIATGGSSHPETGATADGFSWLASVGHRVAAPTPDVVPLAVADKWVKDLSGVSLSFMKISFYLDGIRKFSKTGKILFTHFGLSGPLILNSAREVSGLLKAGVVTAKIDAYPDTDLGTLDEKLVKIFDLNKNKDLKNITKEFMPEGMDETIFALIPELHPNKKVHSVSKEKRKLIVQMLKALPVTVTNLMGFDRAVVADGGVSLEEIDTKTMRSKLQPNLFVTGDLLNINRKSGGFSLQLCWTTGFVAGSNVQ